MSGFFQMRNGLIVQQRGYWDSAQLARVHPDAPVDVGCWSKSRTS
ncbi:hypothetical protein [Mycolicibacterium pyrenivorans]|nr:hypothetical protein [Mycolicibacterium pyrenivorans]